ncbi:hypothetical protein [Algibacter pectinivorans]|uniref:Uncharacterized protein n=1 Tax=Algibacter pectinivorans TaxID=870482 RepID=A0A1I1RUI9_9FLAO|nr:hypothetical protein [Algibacter pectinivorans]SFD35193.1 hypothetical protein SAMN04487987_11089 [Algibacter pectinivorans]
MAKQSQPKVSELVEVLIQQMSNFDKVIRERNDILNKSISKLNSIKVDFNVAELEAMKQSNRDIIKNDFENFHAKTRENNKELLNIHKKVSSKRLLYLIILNVFFLSTAGLSFYIAVKNSVEKSEYENVLKDRNKFKKQAYDYHSYFLKNQKEALKYNNWKEK